MKKYLANPGYNQMKNGVATAASIKHKYYSFTIIMYYLNTRNKDQVGVLKETLIIINALFKVQIF